MVTKSFRDAIDRVYALNDEVDEATEIFAFPLDKLAFEAIIASLKEYATDVFLPKSENGDSDDGVCSYIIARVKNDANGYTLYAFITDREVDRCIDAVRQAAAGNDPD